jgi:purine-binding chemotaxis protein CheW
MTDVVQLEDRAALLRQEFDRSFAAPPETEQGHVENLLAVTIGGHPYAFRLAEVGGLLADRRIVPLPASVPSSLGIIGYRSLVIPVFDIATMLGYPPAAEPRWIALAGTSALPVGLAFEHFEAQVRLVLDSGLSVEREAGQHHTAVTGAIRQGTVVRSILNIAALLAALPRASTPARKEP